MADIITSKAEIAAFIDPSLVLELANRELAANAILANYVTNMDAFTVGQTAEILKVKKFGVAQVTTRACGTKGEANTIAVGTDDLVKKNAYGSFMLDDCCDTVISKVAATFFQRYASAMGRSIDTEIINILAAASPAPTITGGLTAANIAKAKTELNCCFADPSKLILLVGCDQEEALLNLADINSASMFSNLVMQTGSVKSLLGFQVVVSQNPLLEGKAFAYSTEAIGLGYVQQLNYRQLPEAGLGTRGYRTEMDLCYYIGALQTGECGVGPTESPWIVEIGM